MSPGVEQVSKRFTTGYLIVVIRIHNQFHPNLDFLTTLLPKNAQINGQIILTSKVANDSRKRIHNHFFAAQSTQLG